MKVLAIDTSAVTATVAVADEEKILGEISFTTSLTHSQTIMPMIESILKGLNLTIKDIDLFAVSNGPGSFTGLRIGIGTIMGLCYGTDKKVVGVCALEALSYNIPFPGFVIAPIMDARREQVYNALYKFENGKLICLKEPRAISIEDLSKELDSETVFVGDGVFAYREKLTNLLGEKAHFAPINLCLQRASSVCLAALNNNPISAGELRAVYLRKPQAERELLEKKENNI